MRRLRRNGRIEIVREPVLTSARRWMETGIARTTVANQLAIAAYLMGMTPLRIARWYHRLRMSRRLKDRYPEVQTETAQFRM
jgi:hypothetical protein